MKRSKVTNLPLHLAFLALAFSACQKETSPEKESPAADDFKRSHVLPDDPAKIAAIPLILFSENGAVMHTASRKKPTTGSGGTGTTSGGSTTGGSTGGSTGDTTIIAPAPSMPSSFSLTMPPVQNQGGENSCAVFAATYAARSAEQYYRTAASWYSPSANIFSPEFVYNQTKISDCGSGAGLLSVMDFMKLNGACTWQSLPYSSSNGCSMLPEQWQRTEAQSYKISSYARLLTSDVAAIKSMLVNKHPVIITVDPDNSFYNAGPGFVWSSYNSGRGLSHALVICGYDDSKGAYKVFNSWGTGWGEGGYSWISYSFLPQAAFYYSYVINL